MVTLTEKNLRLQYFYLRDGSHTVTVVYILDKNNGEVRWGASFCSKNDVFKKTIGRKIARGRMCKTPQIFTADMHNRGVNRTIQCTIKRALLTYYRTPKGNDPFKPGLSVAEAMYTLVVE